MSKYQSSPVKVNMSAAKIVVGAIILLIIIGVVAGASVCGLLEEGVVSKKVVANFSKSFLLSIKYESPKLARKQALDYIGKSFTECPFNE